MQTFALIPTTPTGYVLNQRRGAFAIVVPEATTNLVTNPSFELNATGWAAVGVNITAIRVGGAGLFGAYGLAIASIGGEGATSGARYTFGASIALEGIYTASAYVLAPFGTTVELRVNGTTVAREKGRGSSLWFRLVGQPIQISSAGSATIDVIRTATSFSVIVDGVQLEQKAYATTYCDGDQQGFVPREFAYLWTAQAHASTSQRLATTAAGGKIVNLHDLGYLVLAILGMGMPTFNVIASPTPQGGAYYQNTITQSRTFSLVGVLSGVSELALDRQRSQLAQHLSPQRLQRPQPLRMIYENYAQDGVTPISEQCDLICHYGGGLEGQRSELFQERSTPEFRMFLPYFARTGFDSQAMFVQASVVNADYIIQRNRDGVWSAVGSGLSTDGLNDAIDGDDGYRYVGGSFNSVVGVANTSGIARWNMATSTWSAVGTGTDATENVNKLIKLANGNILALGSFPSMSGVANTRFMALWNITTSTWSSIGTVAGGSQLIEGVIAPNGYIYVGGNFTTIDGVAGPHIAVYDGSSWSSMGTGPTGFNPTVYALEINQAGTQVYAGGSFTLMGGVANTLAIASWSPTAGDWSALSTGVVGDVFALRMGPNDALYVGGGFTSAGGVTAEGIATWNGTAFAELGGGIQAGGNVADLEFDFAGNLHIVGNFATIGSIVAPDGYAIWNGSTYISAGIIMPGFGTFNYLSLLSNGDIWFSTGVDGTATTAATTTIDYTGTAPSYPTFKITGPTSGDPKAIYQIVNETTNVGIYFNLSILPSEIITLDLDPRSPTYGMTSNTRGNLIANILAGSNLADWSLQPGNNDVSVFTQESTMTVTAIWRVNYLAIEDAVIQ